MGEVANLDIIVRAINATTGGIAKARADIKRLGAETAAANAASVRSGNARYTQLSRALALENRIAKQRAALEGLNAKRAQQALAAEAATMRTRMAGYGRMQSSLRLVGSSMTTYVTIPMAAASALSGVYAYKYQKNMQKVAGINRQNAAQMALYNEQLSEMAAAVGRGPAELADALYFVTSVGFEGSKALQLVELSAKGAAIGMGEANVVADALTGVLQAYGPAAISATTAMDQMLAAIRLGKAEPAEFAQAIGMVLPTAAKMGVEFDQVAASIANMTMKSISTPRAVTALNNFMLGLMKGSEAGEKYLAAHGSSYEKLQQIMRDKGPIEAMQEIERLTGGNQKALKQIVPNIRSLRALWGLLTGDGKTLASTFSQVKNATGELDEAFGKWSQTDVGKLERGWAQFLVQLKDAGAKVLPVASELLGMVTGLIDGFGSLPDVVKKAALGFGLFLAVAGPLSTGLSTVFAGLRTLQSIRLARVMGEMTRMGSLASGAAAGAGTAQAASRTAASVAAAGTAAAVATPKSLRFVGMLGRLAKFSGIAALALAGAGGLYFALKKVADAAYTTKDKGGDPDTIMEGLTGINAESLRKWSNKTMGGHYVVENGELVWKPKVEVAGLFDVVAEELNSVLPVAKRVNEQLVREDITTAEARMAQRLEAAKERRADLHQEYLDAKRHYDRQRGLADKMNRYSGMTAIGDPSKMREARQAWRDQVKVVNEARDAYEQVGERFRLAMAKAQIKDRQSEIDRYRDKLKSVADKPWSVELELKKHRWNEKIKELEAELRRIQKENRPILLKARVDAAKRDVKDLGEIIAEKKKQFEKEPWNVELQAEIKALEAEKEKAEKELRELTIKQWMATLSAKDNASGKAKIAKKLINAMFRTAVNQLLGVKDNASGPARIIKNTLQALFGGTITQTINVVQTGGGSTQKTFRGPRKAEGDYITRPTIALVGEAGPELILPLTKPNRMAYLMREAGLTMAGGSIVGRSPYASYAVASPAWSSATAGMAPQVQINFNGPLIGAPPESWKRFVQAHAAEIVDLGFGEREHGRWAHDMGRAH